MAFKADGAADPAAAAEADAGADELTETTADDVFIGDMTTDEFTTLMAGIMAQSMTGMAAATEATATKAANATAAVTAAATAAVNEAQALKTTLTAQAAQLAALDTALKAAQTQLAELAGEQPAGAKRASQDTNTVTNKAVDAPAPDPMAKVLDFIGF